MLWEPASDAQAYRLVVGTEKPWRGVIDGNSVDYFRIVPKAFEFLQAARDDARIDLLFTHDVVEEILADPDAEQRVTNILHLLSYARMVRSGIFVVGYSRLDMARLGDALSFEDLRAHDNGLGKKNNTRDAIIAATAMYEGCPVVSNDERLRARANRNGVEAITPGEALTRMGFHPG